MLSALPTERQQPGANNTITWDRYQHYREPDVWIHRPNLEPTADVFAQFAAVQDAPVVFIAHLPLMDDRVGVASASEQLLRDCPALQRSRAGSGPLEAAWD